MILAVRSPVLDLQTIRLDPLETVLGLQLLHHFLQWSPTSQDEFIKI